MFRVALSVLGPGFEADAEDVAQETFIRPAERLQGFRGECRIRTWLHRLALNLALDCRRRARWRLPHLDLTVLERRLTAEGKDELFTSAADAERARTLHECVDALPDSLRSVIHLRYWLDYTIEDIATTLRSSHWHGQVAPAPEPHAPDPGPWTQGSSVPFDRVPGGRRAADPVAAGPLSRPQVCLEARP